MVIQRLLIGMDFSDVGIAAANGPRRSLRLTPRLCTVGTVLHGARCPVVVITEPD